MNRRPYKEGSIYKNKKGDGWVASISYTDRLTGKRVRRRKHAATKTEAAKHLKAMKTTHRTNGRLPDEHRTLAQAVKEYAEHRRSNPALSQGTHEKDDWMRSLIVDGLGKCKTNELALPDCEIFLRRAATGLTTSSNKRTRIGNTQLRLLRNQLINVLGNEIRLGLLSQNVASLSQPPATSSKAKKAKQAMKLRDFETLLSTATGPIALLIEFVGRYGMRPAEARAIRWSAIDLDAQILKVLEEMTKENKHGPVKTSRSERSITLGPGTIGRLRQHQPIQKAQLDLLGDSWTDHTVVAATEFGGPHSRYQFNYQCKKLCKQLDIPEISPYELRHTAVSYQAERGHSAWEIADWAGTSEKMISTVYRHQLNKVSKLKPI